LLTYLQKYTINVPSKLCDCMAEQLPEHPYALAQLQSSACLLHRGLGVSHHCPSGVLCIQRPCLLTNHPSCTEISN